MMNRSMSSPPTPPDAMFTWQADPVIPDMPDLDLPNDAVLLADMSADDKTGGVCEAHTENGTKIALWMDPNGYRSLLWHSPVRDMSDYTHIEFMMYSANATGCRFSFELRGNWKGAKSEPPYFRYEMGLTWKGWRKISVRLSTLDGAWGGKINDIRFIGFHSTNWSNDMYGIPGSIIYISDIWICKRTEKYAPDMTKVNEELFDCLRRRWTSALIGNEELNALPIAHENTVSIVRHGHGYWAQMDKTPDAKCLWAGFDNMREGHHVQMHAERLYYMARAWAAVGSEYYHDEKLLADIRFGLDWIVLHGYGEELIKLGTVGNWWQWKIGIPLALVKCLLLIYDRIDQTDIKRWLVAADWQAYYPTMTQANRIWISYVCILSSLLQRDGERMVECIRRMQTVFGFVDIDDGFYRDGSFIQHTNVPYIGGYGSNYLYQIVDFFYVLNGTPLELDREYSEMVFAQFFNSYAPFIYGGIMQKSVSGRGVLSDGLAVGNVTSILRMIETADSNTRNKIFALIASYREANPVFAENLEKNISAISVPYYDEILRAKASDAPKYTRVFGAMDRAVSRTDKYCMTLSLSSSRTVRWETINGQNNPGWYLGDGALWIVTDDLQTYGGDYYRYVNYYRIPGTTVTDVKRVADNIIFGPRGSYRYVGGVSDGMYGVVAAHQGMTAHNFPFPFGFKSDLDNRKLWFFFPGGVLCMMSGLSCTDDNTVYTIIENRMLKKDGECVFTCDGKELSLQETDCVVEGANIVYCSEFGSYVMEKPTDLIYRKNHSERDFFELAVSHGKHPGGDTLAYYLLPYADEKQAKEFVESNKIRIMSNTESLMSACDTEAKISAYAFFEKGCADGITAEPCVIISHETENGVEYTVSEPTHCLPSVSLEFDSFRTIVKCDDNVSAEVRDGRTYVTIDTNGAIGSSRHFTLA